MNHLIVRKGPEFQFIVNPFRIPFEKKVIEAYIKSSIITDYPMPHATLDLFDYAFLREPEHFAASYLAYQGDDYFQEISEFDDREVHEYCKTILDGAASPVGREALELLCSDITAVLEYNNMSFSSSGNTMRGEETYLLKNIPFQKVW